MRVMPKQNAIEQSMRTCARMGFGGGLYLIRGKTDGHHYWRVDFSFDGKRNTLSIGEFPSFSPDKARQQADAQIALARSGGDPSALRNAAKNQDMNHPGESALHKFEILHPESFQAQAKLWLAHEALGWEKNTWAPTLRRLELYHVAFVIDVFDRRIVGWRQSRSMRTYFVLDALKPNPVFPPV